MRRTASDNRFWYRILPWIVGLAAVFSASGLLFRMLWFDEVLTVNLLMKLPLHRIYFAYEIPNNHIVFTLLEKLWYSAVSAAAVSRISLRRRFFRSRSSRSSQVPGVISPASPSFLMRYSTIFPGSVMFSGCFS